MVDETKAKSGRQSSDDEKRREENYALVEKFFSPDVTSEDWMDMYASDGAKEVPFALPDMSNRWDGRAGLEDSKRINSKRGWSNVEHLDQEIYPTVDPDVFFILSHTKAQLKNRPYNQSYIHMLCFREGKIFLYREWFNPLQLLESRGGTIALADDDDFANPS